MAENWDAIGADIAKGIGGVGFVSTLERSDWGALKPWDNGEPVSAFYSITGVDAHIEIRDSSGILTGETKRVLTIAATDLVPTKADRVAVGVTPANADSNRGSQWSEIDVVRVVAPGGVPILYKIELKQ